MGSFQVDVAATDAGVPIVRVHGSITAETADLLSETLYGVLEAEPPYLTVDLSHAGHIASAGLGALVSLLRKVKQNGGELVLQGLSSEIQEMFQVTHLETIFTIVDSDTVT